LYEDAKGPTPPAHAAHVLCAASGKSVGPSAICLPTFLTFLAFLWKLCCLGPAEAHHIDYSKSSCLASSASAAASCARSLSVSLSLSLSLSECVVRFCFLHIHTQGRALHHRHVKPFPVHHVQFLLVSRLDRSAVPHHSLPRRARDPLPASLPHSSCPPPRRLLSGA